MTNKIIHYINYLFEYCYLEDYNPFYAEFWYENYCYDYTSEKVINEFKRELLDQQLRVVIKQETEAQRNLILAYTFSKTGLQE